MLNSQETEQNAQGQERSYDTETLHKVTALASRLQHDHQDRVTAGEVEALGMEVGLQPQFIQQAMAQVDSEQSVMVQQAEIEARERTKQEQEQHSESYQTQRRQLSEQEVLTRKQRRTTHLSTRAEFYSVLTALGLPMLVGFLAYFLKSHPDMQWAGQMEQIPRQGMMQLFTLVLPLPLALLQGFLAGRRRVGFIAAATMILALAPTVPFLAAASPGQYQAILVDIWGHLPEMFLYSLVGIPIAGVLGLLGAWIRQQFLPLTTLGPAQNEESGKQMGVQHREYSPGAVLPYSTATTTPQYSPVVSPSQLKIGQQARAQRVQSAQTTHGQVATSSLSHGRRTYLSIDVDALTELRQSATLAAVDYSFGQLRAWIEEMVRAGGGDLQVGLEGSLLASFPTDAQALQIARRVQQELPKFNQTLNRLPMPFRLRCGISAGTAGSMSVIERSHTLLKVAAGGEIRMGDEVGAAALAELGTLTPLPDAGVGEPAYVWQNPV